MERSHIGLMLTVIVVAGLFVAGSVIASSTDGTIDPTAQYAWGENVGWLNFGTSQGNVHVQDDALTGYAWGENIGWLSLNCSNTNSCATVNYNVANDGEGTLTGHAWGENIGWVVFNPTHGGVTIDVNGDFSGYAWGENIGWVVFNCATTSSCATVNYKVTTDWRPASSRGSQGAPSVQGVGGGGDNIPPGSPTAITISGSNGRVLLRWTDPNAGDLNAIEILRNDGGVTPIGGSPYSSVGAGAGTFEDTNVVAGISYSYILRAVDRVGNRSSSDLVSVTVQASVQEQVGGLVDRDAESLAILYFQQIYGRSPSITYRSGSTAVLDAQPSPDRDAIIIAAYRLARVNRARAIERASLRFFSAFFGRIPQNKLEWGVARMVAYSGLMSLDTIKQRIVLASATGTFRIVSTPVGFVFTPLQAILTRSLL